MQLIAPPRREIFQPSILNIRIETAAATGPQRTMRSVYGIDSRTSFYQRQMSVVRCSCAASTAMFRAAKRVGVAS